MTMEYHRGRARGTYRRISLGISKDFPGANSFDSILLSAVQSQPGVQKYKSIWLTLTGFQTGAQDYVSGFVGLLRSSGPPQNVLDMNDPNISSPKPFVWTAANGGGAEIYLNGLNLAANEAMYLYIRTNHVGGTPAILGQMKAVLDTPV